MKIPIVFSTYTIEPIFLARKSNLDTTLASTDLGITTQVVRLYADEVEFENGLRLSWNSLENIQHEPQSCFIFLEGELHKVQAYSEITGRYYSLYPTRGAPTMLLSGIPMHRIKDIDPYEDTLTKIRAIQPFGKVLDTTTGLGYTAIQAAKLGEHITTIELDPVVLEICHQNPWSQALFENPLISQIINDSFDEIQNFQANQFSRVIHDPPTFSLAGDLFSSEFYSQVYRVLKPSGRLFHYIGDLNSSSGRRVVRGVIQRLEKCGFTRIIPRPEAFGVIALKH